MKTFLEKVQTILRFKDYRTWTPKEIKILKEMIETNKTAEDIAKIIDRSIDAIYHKAGKLGLSFIENK